MKQVLVFVMALLLSACGVDTAATAVTLAELRAKEAQEAKKTIDRVQNQLNEAMKMAEQRRREAEAAIR